MGRPLNKKYFGKRNTGATGAYGNTSLLPTDYDLGGLKALNASVGTAGSYTQSQAAALTTTFPKPALSTEGGVTAVGTPTFNILTATVGGTQTQAYLGGAGNPISVVYGGVTSTFTPTLTSSTTGITVTSISTAGVTVVASGTYVKGQDFVVTGGTAAGTYYVQVGGSSVTSITINSSYAAAIAGTTPVLTGGTGGTAVLGATYNTVASVGAATSGTYQQAGVTSGLASAQATTQATSSGAGLTLAPASFAVNGVSYSNAGNGYINTVPVTPGISATTVTTIASGAYGTITVGAVTNTITLGTAQAAGTFYIGQVVTFTGTASTNFIDSSYSTGNSYLVTATNGTSTLTLVTIAGTAPTGGAAGAVTGLSIVLYKETVSSTDQLVPGLKVVTTGSGGSLSAGTYYIIAVNGATEIVLSSSVGGNAAVVTSATSLTITTVVSGNTAITFGSGSAAATMTFQAQVTTGYTGNYAAMQAVALATTGGVARQDTDIIKQENTQRFRVENADGVFYAKLVNTFPTVGGTMAINAVDSAGGQYWVTKITNRRCRVTRNGGTQFTDGSTVNWTFGSPVASVSVKIDNV
jgi:hypothetical protein